MNISIYNQTEALKQYAEAALKEPNLSNEQEKEFIKIVQMFADDKSNPKAIEARNALIVAYLKVVFKTLAYGYQINNIQVYDIEDLLHEGIQGLNNAIYKYDFERKASFNTCAQFYIRKEISYRLTKNKSTVVSKPEKNIIEENKLERKEQDFLKMHGRYPEPEELAKLTNMPLKKVLRILKEKKKNYVSLDAISASVFDNSSPENPIVWEEILSDPNQEALDVYVINRVDDYTYCEEVLSLLEEDIDKEIMDYIFSTPNNRVSHQEIADELGYSRQHVDKRIKNIREILCLYGYGKCREDLK